MSQEDLENALSGIEYDTDEESTYIYYKVYAGKSNLDRYDIYTHKSDSKVYKIEVNNAPKFSTFEKWLTE